MDFTPAELTSRIKWCGFAIIVLGTLVYLYAGDLETLAGKVVANGSGSGN